MFVTATDDTADLRRLCEAYYARSVSGRKMLVRDIKAWDRARGRVAELTGEIFTGKRWEPIVQSYTATQPAYTAPLLRYIPRIDDYPPDPREAITVRRYRARLIVDGETLCVGIFETTEARDEAVNNAKMRVALGLPIKGA